jgi:curved DNA-binding protein CbpA
LKDYYKILSIDHTANAEEIKKAYRKLALQYHPDINNTAMAAELFVQINEAYQVLSNEDSKRRYDINYKYGLETRELFVKEDKYRSGDGRKYGTAYKYPNQPPRKPKEDENFFKANRRMNTVMFYILLVLGLSAIYASVRDLFAGSLEDKSPFTGLAFGLSFTSLLIYGFWYYYYKKHKED